MLLRTAVTVMRGRHEGLLCERRRRQCALIEHDTPGVVRALAACGCRRSSWRGRRSGWHSACSSLEGVPVMITRDPPALGSRTLASRARRTILYPVMWLPLCLAVTACAPWGELAAAKFSKRTGCPRDRVTVATYADWSGRHDIMTRRSTHRLFIASGCGVAREYTCIRDPDATCLESASSRMPTAAELGRP